MPAGRKLRLAVLISGGGTNLQALIDSSLAGRLSAEIVVVASDRPDAKGLARAENAGIPRFVVDYKSSFKAGESASREGSLPVDLEDLDRVQKILNEPDTRKRQLRLARLVLAEQELIRVLDRFQPDYVCLAGFMRLVTPYFLSHYNQNGKWRVLNIHPALLPAFPGQHGYEDTFAYGCRWGGVTIHFVDEGEDSGPIIAQAVYPIWPHDTIEAIRRRGLQLEYEIYPQCINWLASDCVKVSFDAHGRVSTVISDPAYTDILRSWLQKAFSS